MKGGFVNIYRYDPFISTDYDDFDVKVLEQLSSNPFENIFNSNIEELRKNSETIEFNSSRYDMRPDLVAWDYYQSLTMTNLILLVNNCITLFNFTRENLGDAILLPKKIHIEKLLNSQL